MKKPTFFMVPIEKIAKMVGLPISTVHRVFTIRQFGWEHYKYLHSLECKPKEEVYPNYKKIKDQLDSFHFVIFELVIKRGGIINSKMSKKKVDEIISKYVSEEEKQEIVSKYNLDLLTYPFEMREPIKTSGRWLAESKFRKSIVIKK